MTKHERDKVSVGDLVRFAEPLYPIKKSSHAGIWLWKLGIVIEIDRAAKEVLVLSDGELHATKERLIKVTDEKE